MIRILPLIGISLALVLGSCKKDPPDQEAAPTEETVVFEEDFISFDTSIWQTNEGEINAGSIIHLSHFNGNTGGISLTAFNYQTHSEYAEAMANIVIAESFDSLRLEITTSYSHISGASNHPHIELTGNLNFEYIRNDLPDPNLLEVTYAYSGAANDSVQLKLTEFAPVCYDCSNTVSFGSARIVGIKNI